jgi:hypothetical protein
MAIEKALYEAPIGIEELIAQDDIHPVEIEIEDPESVSIDFGGLEIEISKDYEDDFYANLAEELDESSLTQLAGDLIGDFESDISSRKDWIQTYVDGLELLGLKIEERSEPWEGACGIYHPLLSEALVKFQSETITSTFPAQGPVRTKIIGKETQDKKESAVRVQDDMNYQLTEVMQEFRPETERLYWGVGLSGNGFKKVYDDPSLGRQVSMYCPAEDVVVPYGASDIQSAERVTHVMRKTENEMRRLQLSGFYRDVDLGEPAEVLDEVEKAIAEKLGFKATVDDRYKVLEMHVNLDLEGFEDTDDDGEHTGLGLPYIVTIEKGTQTILSIRRNWKEEDKLKQKRQHFVHYGYIPGFGFYYFGLVHLIGAYAKSGTSIIRQLVDAGTLSNLPGGFKTRGMRVKGDDTPIAPGEWRDVDVASGVMRDNIIPLPYKEPSQVLYSLLNTIIEEGRRFANTADMKISDMSANAPVGTTLALLERTLKTMSAVQARIHFSFKQELKLLKDLIASSAPEDYPYEPVEGSRFAKRSDYEDVDVIPVSDPNAATMAQKIVQYQAVLQLAQQSPQLYNMPLLHRQMLDVLGIKDASKLVPLEDDMKPLDPVTENQNVLMQKPVKAFAYQDHQAHIMVHMNAMQDPKILQVLGQSPQAPQLQAAMQAHINEHLGFAYRVEIEKQLGMNLPPVYDEMGEPNYLDAEVEARLAPMLAQAAQQLLQQNQAQAAQAQAQQQAQDPIIQMQQQELQMKMQELQMKAQKDQADIQLRQQQLEIERERIAAQNQATAVKAEMDNKRIDTQAAVDNRRIAVDAVGKVAEIEADRKKEMLHLGASVYKDMAKRELQEDLKDKEMLQKHFESANKTDTQKGKK